MMETKEVAREKDYAQLAKEKILKLKADNNGTIKITTTQLRKILYLVNVISNKLDIHISTQQKSERLSEEIEDLLVNLKVKIAYQSAKEESLRKFEETVKLTDIIDEILDLKSSKALKKFISYVEALVAYHKFLGGKE